MPNYAYRGLDKTGKQIAGEISADDERSALALVKHLGLFPTEMKALGGGKAASRQPVDASGGIGISFGKGVGSADLAVFSRQLANLVGGGLPLMRVFSALTEHSENPRLRAALTQMHREVQGGKALWEAMAEHPKIFPTIYVSMIKAGEASGQLAGSLQWLADYLEKEQARKLQIRSALAYPTLLVTVGSIAVFLLLTLVVPKFVTIFEEFDQALPLPTVLLLGFSSFVARWWWAVFGICGGLILGLRQYARTARGRVKVDGWKLKIPLFGKLGMKSAVSRFARTTADR
jgi:general secretion pathway protein F